ncbi:MAG: cysteine peptidase family C39 domain-containing protein [Candidatus Xenobia bacterium]
MSTFVLFDQHAVAPGDPDACGTTSLAMVLASAGRIPPTIAAAQALDQQTRPRRFFTPADALRDAAAAHGLQARKSYDCSLVDLANATARGPVILLIKPDLPHYVVALSATVDHVVIADPWTGTQVTMPASQLAAQWGYLAWKGWMLSFDGRSYGAGDRTTWADVAADLIVSFVRLWRR